MSYAYMFATEITKFVICERLSLPRYEMIWDPSNVGDRDVVVVACSLVTVLVELRKEVATKRRVASACIR